jgi:hypothetical protein
MSSNKSIISMKRISNLFTTGLVLTVIWIIVFTITITGGILISKHPVEMHPYLDYFIWMDLLETILSYVSQFCIVVASLLYVWEKICDYNREEELEKIKLEEKVKEDVEKLQYKRTVSEVY